MHSPVREWLRSSREKLAGGDLTEADLQDLERLLDDATQKILYLYSKSTNMRSPLAGWALYDATQPHEPALPSQDPPYDSVIAAIADGWRVIQLPRPELRTFSDVDNFYVGYEFILERYPP